MAAASKLHTATLASLPLPVTQQILTLLPPDERGRAACVCRAWRDALAGPLLWTCLDFSEKTFYFYRAHSGEFRRLNHDALLLGASARAHGQLCKLDVSSPLFEVAHDTLHTVVAANAGSLRELRVYRAFACATHDLHTGFVTLDSLVAAAPLLRVLHAEEVSSTYEEALILMRAEGRWAPVRMCSLKATSLTAVGLCAVEDFISLAAALEDVALQPTLSTLAVNFADTARPEVMGALADAAISRRLFDLTFQCCTAPAPAPLARLLRFGALRKLSFVATLDDAPLFDTAGAALVGDALRATTVLVSLRLEGLRHIDCAAAVELVRALVSHTSLSSLSVSFSDEEEHGVPCAEVAALCTELGALVAADAPALLKLDLRVASTFEGEGLAPIVDVLRHNRHLRELTMWNHRMSESFACGRLLPAVTANTGLQLLLCTTHAGGDGDHDAGRAAVEEAEQLVNRRKYGRRG